MPVLKEGDQAPEFCLPADDGTDISLSELRGNSVLLFFFPKALTPG